MVARHEPVLDGTTDVATKFPASRMSTKMLDGVSTTVIERAHARGLLVHTWTFRNDASGYGFADPQAEMAYYMRLGVDGMFTDFPGTCVAARDTLR